MRLSPLAKSVLFHLRNSGSFTKLKAERYGIESLAFGVFLLRKAGYPVQRTLKRDDFGRRYASYTLPLAA